MNNPYKLPIKFKNIIRLLNRLRFANATNKPLKVKEFVAAEYLGSNYYMVKCKKYDLYIPDEFERSINGCLANRFNTTIYNVLRLYRILYKKYDKEISNFVYWLVEQDRQRIAEAKITELSKQATDLGFKLTNVK